MSHEEDIIEPRTGAEGYQPKINDIAQNFLTDLEKERSRLAEDFPLLTLLIEEAIERVYTTGRIPGREFYADVLKQKPMKLTQKVFVPVKQYSKFNFTGKILGPKGNSLRRLQEETQCKITIKGRNSMRDKTKEEELRNSEDPRYSHLHKDLFLEISTVATPAECYARVAYALSEIRKYVIPDKNDEVSHEQLREIMEIDPELAKSGYGSNPKLYKTVFDKSDGLKGTLKYISLLKNNTYRDREDHREEPQEEQTRQLKRPSYGYENMKASSTSGYKRTAATTYAEHKRYREETTKKPFRPYSVVKK